MHKVGFCLDNPPERRFRSFKMHEIASQQSFGDANRTLLVKRLRKNHAERFSLTPSFRALGPVDGEYLLGRVMPTQSLYVVPAADTLARLG